MPSTHRPTVTWWTGVTLGAVLVASQLVLPVDSAAWDAAYMICAAAATVVLMVTSLRMSTPLAWVWRCFAGFAALWLLADVMYLVLERSLDEVPFPGWPDLPYLASYLMAIAGLVILGRRLHPGRDVDAWVDAAIVTVAAAAVMAALFLVPTVSELPSFDATAVLTIAYPLADVAILATLLRIAFGSGRLSGPAALIVGAFVAVLVADLLYNVDVVSGGSDVVVGVYQALYLVGYVLLAGAAALPTASVLGGDPVPTPSGVGGFRGRLVAIGVLTAPVVMLVVVWPDERPLEQVLAVLTMTAILLALLRIRLLLRVVDRQARMLGREARTDALTALPNRRTLDFEVERMARESVERRVPLTVAMLDLDHFKDYNDAAGHQAGDDYLRRTAAAWRATVPGPAFLARYGGEEFALLLPGLRADEAYPVLEGLRAATPAGCTVSVGYAQLLPGEMGFDALHRADVALFAAKAAGRDRVMAATATLDHPR